MIRKIIITILLLVASSYSQAQQLQQKIGTNPTIISSSAALEVESANKGVLIPRIALTSATDVITINAPTTSLLVYNTNTSGISPNNIIPGFYYWNGNRWTALASTDNGIVIKKVACAGTKVQTISDPNTPASDGILVSYEDPSGDVINAVVKSRNAGVSFDVEFAAVPPSSAFLIYAYPGNIAIIPTGPQGPQGVAGTSIIKGLVPCVGTFTQTITNTNVTATSSITVTYEDPSGDLIYVSVKTRTAGTGFVVQFAALPPTTAKINYTIVP